MIARIAFYTALLICGLGVLATLVATLGGGS